MKSSWTQVEPNVDRVTLEGKNIYVVGTAHISQASADQARRVIEEIRPDAVAVELCASRFETIRDSERWRKTDIVQILKDGKPLLFLVQLILAAFQKKLGDKLKVKPGAEMVAAIEKAEEHKIPIILADREVKTTLKRAFAAVGVWSIVKLFLSSLWAMIKNPKIDEGEVERLKSGEALEGLMQEFTEALPDVKAPLIDERDLYLTSKIREGTYKTVVAVVGAGHVPGMKECIDAPIDRDALDVIPSPSPLRSLTGLILPLIVFTLFAFSFNKPNEELTQLMTKSWLLYTAIGATIGGIIACSHPLTIFCMALCAPFAALMRFGTVGKLAARIEVSLRAPTDDDKKGVVDALASVKGIWTNRVARVFLVMILTNAGTTIATIWCIKALIKLLSLG